MVDMASHMTINLETKNFEPSQIENLDVHSSIFSYGGCGERLQAQSLEVNFTPDEKDDECSRSKCCAFWEAVNECAEMQKFKVLPEKQSPNKSTASSNLSKPIIAEKMSPVYKDRTALSMLELVERKGLITRVFEAKMPQTTCPMSDSEYIDQTTIMEMQHHNLKPKKKSSRALNKLQNRSSKQRTVNDGTSLDDYEVARLTSTMLEWDTKHPKSMKPPSHSPPLSHCVMQRGNLKYLTNIYSFKMHVENESFCEKLA